MYRNILPYNSERDYSAVPGHRARLLRRSKRHARQTVLSDALRSRARQVRSALRRSPQARATRSMNWWQ